MKFGIVTSFVASASMAVTPALVVAQDKAQVFTPVGQWTVDYGDDYCRLARNFSSGSDTLALAFERIAPGPMARLILISNAIKRFRGAQEIGWRFNPSDPEPARQTLTPMRRPRVDRNISISASSMLAPLVPGKPAAPPLYDRAKEQAAGKAITGFVLESGVATPVEVDTGDLSAPIAALQKCADDLAGTWGLEFGQAGNREVPCGSRWWRRGLAAAGHDRVH